MLPDIHKRPNTAATCAIEVFAWLRRATINELRGIFLTQEIIALAHIHNGLHPAWQIMCNTNAIVTHTVDAEKFNNAVSMYGGDIDALVKKLENLTTAQSTILQFELISFWNREKPDLEQLIKALS